jgi:hypothetical protein
VIATYVGYLQAASLGYRTVGRVEKGFHSPVCGAYMLLYLQERDHAIIKTGKKDEPGLELLSADYPAAPGASGSPVFGVDGDDHRVAGLCKGGRKGVAYTVPASCIRDALKTARGATGWVIAPLVPPLNN